tara:strand:- start:63 stop:683 length:621 start_codon:yes stop_codon:yes gene_type:complete
MTDIPSKNIAISKNEYPHIKLVNFSNKKSVLITYDIYKNFLFLKKYIEDNELFEIETIEIIVEDEINDLIGFLSYNYDIIDDNFAPFKQYDIILNLIIQTRLFSLDKKSIIYGRLYRLVNFVIESWTFCNLYRKKIFNKTQKGFEIDIEKIKEIICICFFGNTETGQPIDLLNPEIVNELLNSDYDPVTTEYIVKNFIVEGQKSLI